MGPSGQEQSSDFLWDEPEPEPAVPVPESTAVASNIPQGSPVLRLILGFVFITSFAGAIVLAPRGGPDLLFGLRPALIIGFLASVAALEAWWRVRSPGTESALDARGIVIGFAFYAGVSILRRIGPDAFALAVGLIAGVLAWFFVLIVFRPPPRDQNSEHGA